MGVLDSQWRGYSTIGGGAWGYSWDMAYVRDLDPIEDPTAGLVIGSARGDQVNENFRHLGTLIDDVALITSCRRQGTVYLFDYGAIGDGTDETAKIQAALDAVAALPDGGTVMGDPGLKYRVGALAVHSNTTLDMQGSVLVKILGSLERFDATIHDASQLAGGVPQTNIEIRNTRFDVEGGGGGNHLTFINATHVRLYNVAVEGLNAAFQQWATRFHNCNDVDIDGYRQDAGTIIQMDGLHFLGGHRITINNANILSGDDAIAFIGGLDDDEDGFSDVTVTNSVLRSRFGRMIAIEIRPQPGTVPALTYEDFMLSNLVGEAGADGEEGGNLIVVRNYRPTDCVIRNISMSNIVGDATAVTAANRRLFDGLNVERLSLSQVSLRGGTLDGAQFTSCDHLRLNRVDISDVPAAGILLRLCDGAVIDGANIDGCNVGIQIGFGADASDLVRVVNSTVTAAASITYFVRRGVAPKLRNNYGEGARGVVLGDVTDADVTDNDMDVTAANAYETNSLARVFRDNRPTHVNIP